MRELTTFFGYTTFATCHAYLKRPTAEHSHNTIAELFPTISVKLLGLFLYLMYPIHSAYWLIKPPSIANLRIIPR